MSEMQLYRLGADVQCADGECGKLTSLVVSPDEDAVTHLVVDQVHGKEPGRLVPLDLVDTGLSASAGGQIRLRCGMAEFDRLVPAETTYSYPGDDGIRPGGSMASWPDYAPPGVMGGPGLPPDPGPAQEFTVDTVPDQLPGEDEVPRGQHAHATDGDIGHVRGIAVDPATGRVTFVLLRMGHLWNRKTVFIPRSAVSAVGADGFYLNITSQDVHHLPHADIDHPAG